MRLSTILAITASFGVACAQEFHLGFNSGATDDTKKVKKQADFEKEFTTAQELQSSPGLFNSARLFTNIQAETTNTPIEAFSAAIRTNTTLLLGIWASGTTSIQNELDALTKAISQYGADFTNLVVGLSVGSEDMYRVSESGIRNEAGVGQGPRTIASFVKDARDALKDTELSDIPIGHVDTWTAWANDSNSAVVDEIDFVGVNLFPYYEDDKPNQISNASVLFDNAINNTKKYVGDKPIWITETGWPITGPDFGKAKATLDNAQTYWETIGCNKLFGKVNVWWYELADSNPDNKAKFGITQDLSTTPTLNLTCPADSGAPAAINTENSDSNNTNDNNGGGDNKDSAASSTPVSLNALITALSVVFAITAWAA